MKIQIIDAKYLDEMEQMEKDLLLPNGKLKLVSSSHYDKYNFPSLRVFCHVKARYGLPTIEVIEFLKELIDGRPTIEIGAGYGDFGYHLGIPTTDSKIQVRPDIKAQYEAMDQPIIEYPEDVEELEALDAIKKYKPQVVFASWVTQWVDHNKTPAKVGSLHGIREDKLLDLVDTYILLGNLDQHGDKDIIRKKHLAIENPHIRSRSNNFEGNRIFVWSK